MAHVQKIARKPKGVGAEIMGVSDVETGILMQLELVEGRHSPRAKLYDKDYPRGGVGGRASGPGRRVGGRARRRRRGPADDVFATKRSNTGAPSRASQRA